MEAVTNPEIQNLPPITPQNNNYKILFFVSLGLLLIISSVLTTLLITQKSLLPTQTINTQETKSITSVPTESVVTPTVVTTPIESATTSSIPKDWKTYTNTTYKYSISYPKDWEIDVKPNQFTILTLTSPEYIKNINNPQNYEGILGDQFEVSFYKNYKNTLTANKNLEEYLSDKNLFTQYVAQKINGLTFYKAEQMGMGVRTVYFNIKGENLFEFSFNSGVTKIDQQIINTLKFN